MRQAMATKMRNDDVIIPTVFLMVDMIGFPEKSM
jgi:hypothetical protein